MDSIYNIVFCLNNVFTDKLICTRVFNKNKSRFPLMSIVIGDDLPVIALKCFFSEIVENGD